MFIRAKFTKFTSSIVNKEFALSRMSSKTISYFTVFDYTFFIHMLVFTSFSKFTVTKLIVVTDVDVRYGHFVLSELNFEIISPELNFCTDLTLWGIIY